MVQRWRQGQRTLLAVAGLGWLAYKALQWERQENLYGQVALITGGSRGLGLALAREFAQVGCRLVLAARDTQGPGACSTGPDATRRRGPRCPL
jgi:hypothetical protein